MIIKINTEKGKLFLKKINTWLQDEANLNIAFGGFILLAITAFIGIIYGLYKLLANIYSAGSLEGIITVLILVPIPLLIMRAFRGAMY